MFDSAPPNLPVEPATPAPAKPQAVPTAMPAPARPVSASPMMQNDKKEPEDIFSGMDVASQQKAANAGEDILSEGPKRSPLLIIGAAAAGFLILAGAGYVVWAFVLQPKPAATPLATAQPTPTQQTTPQQIEQPPVVDQQPAQQVPAQAPVTTPPPGSNIPLPEGASPAATTSDQGTVAPTPASPSEGVDSDKDQLTDTEEAIYGTDPNVADTDGDGFSDGAEVQSIFDPAGKGQSLTKNPAIGVFHWNGWSMLLPKAWNVTSGLQDPSTGIVITDKNTQFLFQSQANAAHQSLSSWIGPTNSAGLRSFTTKNGLSAMQTSDGLTTYVSAGDTILIVTYNLNGDTSYNFRTTYAMLVNSFQPPKK